MVDVAHLAPGGIFLELRLVVGGMLAAITHAVAVMVVAEVKFKPVVAANKNRAAEDAFVADQPGRNQCGEQRGSKSRGGQPGPEETMVHVSGVKKGKRHD